MQNGACVEVCKHTRIHEGKSPEEDRFGPIVATIDPGCSIRNIIFKDIGRCGEVTDTEPIKGNVMNSGPLPPHRNLGFFKKSPVINDRRGRKYFYELYS